MRFFALCYHKDIQFIRGNERQKIMLKHVLVPLDGSELSEVALEYAVQIVAPEVKITLLSVVDSPFSQSY